MVTATEQRKAFADFAAISVGDTATLTHTVHEEAVEQFARLSGDDNPLHMDSEFAGQTQFRRRVVHGMLVASYVSTLVGTRIPGPGALWTQQSFQWLAPVFIGDRIELTAKVLHKSQGTRTVTLGVEAVNQQGAVVLKGEGTAILLEREKEATNVPLCERVVFLSGGTRGAGPAIAAALGAAGVPVAVSYSENDVLARKICDAIRADGGTAMPVRVDTNDQPETREAIESVQQSLGRSVEVLINNATFEFAPKAFQELTWDYVQASIDGDLRRAFHSIQAVLPAMTAKKSGRIINVTAPSSAGTSAAHSSGVQILNGAVRAMTRSLAAELGPLGIRVNSVSPGLMETDFSTLPERVRKLQAMQTPLRKLCRPEDVARAVVFLAGEGGEHLTGVDLPVSGGLRGE